MGDFDHYLEPTYFIDSDHPAVVAFAERACAGVVDDSPVQRAVRLYYAVRDEIRYDPYDLHYETETLRASTVIGKKTGYCVAKAIVLTAVGRQQGIPSRLGFADVRNHLSTSRLRALMGTDLFYYHGYTEFFLEDRWVKATPAFNLSLCQHFQVKPLEFDGSHDAVFHECNMAGQKHMEYVYDHGSFVDLPFETLFAAYRKHYPVMFAAVTGRDGVDFHAEALQERRDP